MEPPDRQEKRVRFGCGFLFGSAAAASAMFWSFWSGHAIIGWCFGAGLVCGYAAMRFGDSFWEAVNRWWGWW